MNEPKVIELLTFAGEGPVPCVRKTDYDALAARLAEAKALLREARGSLAYAFGDQCDEFDAECEGCQAWKLIRRIEEATHE